MDMCFASPVYLNGWKWKKHVLLLIRILNLKKFCQLKGLLWKKSYYLNKNLINNQGLLFLLRRWLRMDWIIKKFVLSLWKWLWICFCKLPKYKLSSFLQKESSWRAFIKLSLWGNPVWVLRLNFLKNLN